MDRKMMNREIRKISNHSSLPLIMYVILSVLLSFGFRFAVTTMQRSGILLDSGLVQLILYLVLYALVFPIIFAAFYVMRGRKTGITIKSCFANPQMPTGWICKWIIIAMGFTYLSGFIANLAFTFLQLLFGIELHPVTVDFGDSAFGVVAAILILPVLAPIFEELLFRGTVYRNTEPMGQWLAIIITGISFGLWHMNYSQMIYTAVMGAMACFLYARTRSLIPSIMLHFFINLIGTVQYLLSSSIDTELLSYNIQYGNEEYIAEYIIRHLFSILGVIGIAFLIFGLIIAAIVLFIIELVKHRGVFCLHKGFFPIAGLKKAAVYFSAPLTIIAFLLMIAGMVIRAIGYTSL